MTFEFFIGGRYLRAKQKQAFISLITLLSIAGVTVGVMALIVVIAVMSGFESDLKSRILGVESHVVLMRHGGGFADYPEVVRQVEAFGDVEAATPFIYSQIMIRSSFGISGAVLRGIDPGSANRVIRNLKSDELEKMDRRVVQDVEPNRNIEPHGIVLGKELAVNLGVSTGDTVHLILPQGMLSPIGHLPAMRRFEVIGLFESGMYEYDSSLAYVHLNDAQKMLRMGDTVTGIEIRVNDVYQAAATAADIINQLGYPYWAKDWMKMNHNLFSALKLEKTVMFIILTLIVLVAAFNIASTLIMMVMEKTRDVAILKTMGATDRSIRRIFVFKGMTIGLIGTVLGVVCGVMLCVLLKRYKFIELPGDVYYITTLPVQLDVLTVLMISGAAMLICYLATLYPARKASGLNPVEAIRYGG